ncbi:MAG: tetratricopeptide repeat protein [Bacteroidaceae bacterium]|nr:tetratricopeptide repeat protein [Bacteroidaceae bacterium]
MFDENEQHNLLYNVIVLACFYIDRFDQNPQLCVKKASPFLEMAFSLCNQYKKQAPIEGLVYGSMINHNYGFLLASVGKWSEAVDYYKRAYEGRDFFCDYFRNDETKNELAETAVNYSDCLLFLNRYDEAIECAKKAMELYRHLLQPEYEHIYMNFYKAQQMLGSIYVHVPDKKAEGLNMLSNYRQWAQAHPDNSYQAIFKNISYKILKANGQL